MCLEGIVWGVVDWIYLALEGQMSGFCEHINEIQVENIRGNFLFCQLNNRYFLKKDSASWG
jgi:hypothetical protein